MWAMDGCASTQSTAKRYPLIVEEGARINVTAIIDAEVVCTDGNGVPTFERLHSRCNDHLALPAIQPLGMAIQLSAWP